MSAIPAETAILLPHPCARASDKPQEKSFSTAASSVIVEAFSYLEGSELATLSATSRNVNRLSGSRELWIAKCKEIELELDLKNSSQPRKSYKLEWLAQKIKAEILRSIPRSPYEVDVSQPKFINLLVEYNLGGGSPERVVSLGGDTIGIWTNVIWGSENLVRFRETGNSEPKCKLDRDLDHCIDRLYGKEGIKITHDYYVVPTFNSGTDRQIHRMWERAMNARVLTPERLLIRAIDEACPLSVEVAIRAGVDVQQYYRSACPDMTVVAKIVWDAPRQHMALHQYKVKPLEEIISLLKKAEIDQVGRISSMISAHLPSLAPLVTSYNSIFGDPSVERAILWLVEGYHPYSSLVIKVLEECPRSFMNLRNKAGKSLLSIAIEKEQTELAGKLRELGAKE